MFLGIHAAPDEVQKLVQEALVTLQEDKRREAADAVSAIEVFQHEAEDRNQTNLSVLQELVGHCGTLEAQLSEAQVAKEDLERQVAQQQANLNDALSLLKDAKASQAAELSAKAQVLCTLTTLIQPPATYRES